jgi:hypothetical protein
MLMTDRDPKYLDPSELRALVRSAPRTPGRNEAFLELVAQDPPGLNRTLRTLALDGEVDQAMRLKAVSALGRAASPSSLSGLRDALAVEDEVVRRRAVARLGKIGTADDLEVLKAVRTGDAATHQMVRVAKCFVSYRHRLGEYRNDVPRRTYAATSSEAVPMRTGALTKTVREQLEVRGVNVPGVDLALDTALRVECPGNAYVLVVNRQFVGDGMGSLGERQAMPAVVVKENIETGAFDPAFYVTTDPAGHGRFHVFGVRSSGAVALYGTGAVEKDAVSFDVSATESPLVHPLRVEASFSIDSGRLRFETGLVEPQFAPGQQQLRRQPREG